MHVIEAFGHTELLFRWSAVWAMINDLSVICHVGESHAQMLSEWFEPHKNISVAGPRNGDSWKKYLKKLPIEKEDVLILNTTARFKHWPSELLAHPRLYMVVHNVKYQFSSQEKFRWKLLPEYLKKIVDQPAKERFHKAVKGIIVPLPGMAEFIRSENADAGEIHVIPFAYQGDEVPSSARRKFRMVVPGTVIEKTRLYPVLIEALNYATAHGLKGELVLAGEAKDEKIVDDFKERFAIQEENEIYSGVDTGGIKVIIYRRLIPQIEYEELLSTASVIIAPVKKDVVFQTQTEEIGRTKLSGAFFDALFHRKRLLLPAGIGIDLPGTSKFTDAINLGDQLLSLAKSMVPVEPDEKYAISRLASLWESLIFNSHI